MSQMNPSQMIPKRSRLSLLVSTYPSHHSSCSQEKCRLRVRQHIIIFSSLSSPKGTIITASNLTLAKGHSILVSLGLFDGERLSTREVGWHWHLNATVAQMHAEYRKFLFFVPRVDSAKLSGGTLPKMQSRSRGCRFPKLPGQAGCSRRTAVATMQMQPICGASNMLES
ncbi:hypothetical protein V8C37DRAFT_375067 [Trichoderma ceciliae]